VPAFCGCQIVPADEPMLMAAAKAKPRKFTFALPYGGHPNYSWFGMGNAKTVAVIRAAFAELSKLSGAKFVETASTSKANIRVYFQNIANGGQYEGGGKIKFSNSRKGVTPAIGRIWLIHEVQHYLGYRANPPSDKFYHSRVPKEIFHINGSGPEFGPHFTSWMRAKYGAK
jgi:hypothetical protein